MKEVLIDTDILSLFFRNNHNVIDRFKEYLKIYNKINISIITFYEILSGLNYRDASKQKNLFEEFIKYNNILPLTKSSVIISSDLYAQLRKTGELIDDIDLLIAGIAMEHNLLLVTHNKKHFNRIEGLKSVDWSTE